MNQMCVTFKVLPCLQNKYNAMGLQLLMLNKIHDFPNNLIQTSSMKIICGGAMLV